MLPDLVNQKLNVLVACEESQTSCIAFRNLGCNAFSCDIQSSTGGHPEWHICSDVLSILNGNCNFITESGDYHFIKKWDLILAHPPCTYLAASSATCLFPNHKLNIDRYNKLLAARDFFFKIWTSNCEHICIENPRPLSIAKLPRPSDVVDPSDFGSKYHKRTYLWLKNLPPIIITGTNPNAKSFVYTRSGSKNRSKSDYLMYNAIASQFVSFLTSYCYA